MKVEFETRGPVDEPYLKLNEEQILAMTLRAGSMEIGLGRSALQRITFDAGLMGLCPPQSEYWIGTCDMTHVVGSEEARCRASLRPPLKLYVPVSGIQLSRRRS